MASVIIGFNEGDNQVYEHDEKQYAYKILNSGVLQLLELEGTDWTVVFEFSQSGWRDVQGTRFIGDTDNLSGFSGTARKEKPKVGKMVVL